MYNIDLFFLQYLKAVPILVIFQEPVWLPVVSNILFN
jgi:hypothetical protein